MALKIRLQRHGNSHRPFYRMVVAESSARRDGRFVEVLGTYEPQAKRLDDELNIKLERFEYWKSVGAKPSDTAASLVRRAIKGPSLIKKNKKSKSKKTKIVEETKAEEAKVEETKAEEAKVEETKAEEAKVEEDACSLDSENSSK